MKKPKMILATNNQHKKNELEQILENVVIQTPDELGIDFFCEETGSSFLENSLLKAKTLFKLTGNPVLADDSGLCVDFLNGEPGIYSSRYGMKNGIELNSSERNAFLLKNMEAARGAKERSAAFVCCMSLILDDYRIFTVQETMKGYISEKPAGGGGFGYDPIFFLPEYNKTVAEISDKQKNSISHRGRAALRIASLIGAIK